ncbi:MAG: hypothetical protein ABII12_14410 [Planctomycetota bacterium]
MKTEPFLPQEEPDEYWNTQATLPLTYPRLSLTLVIQDSPFAGLSAINLIA